MQYFWLLEHEIEIFQRKKELNKEMEMDVKLFSWKEAEEMDVKIDRRRKTYTCHKMGSLKPYKATSVTHSPLHGHSRYKAWREGLPGF